MKHTPANAAPTAHHQNDGITAAKSNPNPRPVKKMTDPVAAGLVLSR